MGHGLPTDKLVRLGMPDRLIGHATRKEQLTEIGLDPLASPTARAATMDLPSVRAIAP